MCYSEAIISSIRVHNLANCGSLFVRCAHDGEAKTALRGRVATIRWGKKFRSDRFHSTQLMGPLQKEEEQGLVEEHHAADEGTRVPEAGTAEGLHVSHP